MDNHHGEHSLRKAERRQEHKERHNQRKLEKLERKAAKINGRIDALNTKLSSTKLGSTKLSEFAIQTDQIVVIGGKAPEITNVVEPIVGPTGPTSN